MGKPHKTPTVEMDKPTIKDESVAIRRFNLCIIKDLFDEYNVDIHRGATLRVLLDTIEQKTYQRLVYDFYNNNLDVISFLQEWDRLKLREYKVNKSDSLFDSECIYVLEDEIGLYLQNQGVQKTSQLSMDIETLVNHCTKTGFEKFTKQFGERVDVLKQDTSRLDVFDDIHREMKMYMDFMS